MRTSLKKHEEKKCAESFTCIYYCWVASPRKKKHEFLDTPHQLVQVFTFEWHLKWLFAISTSACQILKLHTNSHSNLRETCHPSSLWSLNTQSKTCRQVNVSVEGSAFDKTAFEFSKKKKRLFCGSKNFLPPVCQSHTLFIAFFVILDSEAQMSVLVALLFLTIIPSVFTHMNSSSFLQAENCFLSISYINLFPSWIKEASIRQCTPFLHEDACAERRLPSLNFMDLGGTQFDEASKKERPHSLIKFSAVKCCAASAATSSPRIKYIRLRSLSDFPDHRSADEIVK